MAVTEAEVRLEARRRQREKNQEAIRLLNAWVEEGDEHEQSDTFEALKEGLNAHQSSGRTVYP